MGERGGEREGRGRGRKGERGREGGEGEGGERGRRLRTFLANSKRHYTLYDGGGKEEGGKEGEGGREESWVGCRRKEEVREGGGRGKR